LSARRAQATDIGLDRIQDVEVTRLLLTRTSLAALNVSPPVGRGDQTQHLDHQVAERSAPSST
jgi:hypothetical protein